MTKDVGLTLSSLNLSSSFTTNRELLSQFSTLVDEDGFKLVKKMCYYHSSSVISVIIISVPLYQLLLQQSHFFVLEPLDVGN